MLNFPNWQSINSPTLKIFVAFFQKKLDQTICSNIIKNVIRIKKIWKDVQLYFSIMNLVDFTRLDISRHLNFENTEKVITNGVRRIVCKNTSRFLKRKIFCFLYNFTVNFFWLFESSKLPEIFHFSEQSSIQRKFVHYKTFQSAQSGERLKKTWIKFWEKRTW